MANVTFYKNDGTNTEAILNTVSFPALTAIGSGWARESYSFQGWYTSSILPDDANVFEVGTPIVNDTVPYYAIWAPLVIVTGGLSNVQYVQDLTLDLNSNNAYTTISAKQFDSARYLRIFLTKNNIAYEIDPTHSFYFRMRKPDGHGVVNPASVEIERIGDENINHESGCIFVQLTDQCLAAAGRGYADIVEYDATGAILSSIPFIINIMSAPDLGNNITSNDEFKQLSDLMSQTQALFQYAPQIRASDKHWIQYSKNGDVYTEIDTNVVAEGQHGTDGVDGIDGTSTYIVDSKTGEPGTSVIQEEVSVVLSGTNYYSDAACTTLVGTTTKMMVATPYGSSNYTITIDDTIYYVNPNDVKHNDNFNKYYVLTIPEGLQGEQGIQGDIGPRGAAGAGGVTWVDGNESSSERYIESDEIIPIDNHGWIDGVEVDSHTEYGHLIANITWTNASDFSYDEAKRYVNIAFADSSDAESFSSIYAIGDWAANASILTLKGIQDVDENDEVYIRPLESDDLPALSSEQAYYLYGQFGIDSGNVRLHAVAYASQSAFLDHDEFGNEIKVSITPAMRSAARENLEAMKYVAGSSIGDVLTYNGSTWTAQQPTMPQTLLERLNYNDLNVVIQNYQYATVNRNNNLR